MKPLYLIVLALLAAAALTACEGFTKQPGLLEAVGALPKPASDISVMSFNIRYGTADDGDNAWPRRRPMVIDTIASHAPDILGVQEALRFQLDEIRAQLPVYAETGAGRDDGQSAGEYSAILYRRDRLSAVDGGTFWLSDTPETPGSRTWGNQITRICTWVRLRERAEGSGGGAGGGRGGGGGRTFYVYNVHFDHQSEESRQKSADLLAARITGRLHPEDPVIVTGDFNSGEQSPAIRFLRGESASAAEGGPDLIGWTGMTDTFRAIHPGAEGVGTYHAFRGTTAGEKIDFIFIKSGSKGVVEVITADIDRISDGGRWPSDHFPVVARIRLKN